VVHEWAYLPDLAGAMVALAEARERLGPYETFGFPGHAVTGRALIDAIAKAIGRESRDVRVRQMQWWMIKALAPFFTLPRELAELDYLWQIPHRIAGDKLKGTIGLVPHTPLETAVKRALRDLGV